MAVIIFCGVAGKVLIADYKRLLVSGLNLGQPSFLYAYLALLVQSGEYCLFFLLNLFFVVLSFFFLLYNLRVSSTNWMYRCLKTVRKIIKCLLVTTISVADR